MTIRCVLMDIEGTVTPIVFVRDVLFPYAQQRMAAFLRHHRDNATVRHWIELCRDTVAQEQGIRPSEEDLPNILQRWIEQDRKHTGLKGLQGMIWEEGYKTGAFAPALYEDVFDALLAWRADGIQLALYSSGSEQAQRLLIAHTTTGDLTGFFTHFFDTRVGPKGEPASYRHIAETLALSPDAILFLSDIETELDAAAAAGFKTTQIVRPGTEAGTHHPVASSFKNIPSGGGTPSTARHRTTHAA